MVLVVTIVADAAIYGWWEACSHVSYVYTFRLLLKSLHHALKPVLCSRVCLLNAYASFVN